MGTELNQPVTIVINNNAANPPYDPNIKTSFETPTKFSAEEIRKYACTIRNMLGNPDSNLPKSDCIAMIKMSIQDGLTYYPSSEEGCWKKINCDSAKLTITLIQDRTNCKCGALCARNLATGKCTDNLVPRILAPILPEFYNER